MNIKNKYIIGGFSILILLISVTTIIIINKDNKEELTQSITATIMEINSDKITVKTESDITYKFKNTDITAPIGTTITLKYTGILNEDSELQEVEIINYKVISKEDEKDIPTDWDDSGIFSDYYTLAYKKVKELTLDEKIGQMLLVRYNEDNATNALYEFHVGGFVFYAKDFENKTRDEVKTMIGSLQEKSEIPLLTAVDEEGGRIVRVSSNPLLIDFPFKSPQELFDNKNFEPIHDDTIRKSKFLYDLGLNLNLAPVVDVSTNPNDYIFDRTLGENTTLTSEYARTVIEASKGTKVSYTLKHFPGYGSNTDTHLGTSIDTRSYNDIVNNHYPPFISGIEVGAEAILISHNIITSIDPNNPATLSPNIHNELRKKLNFTGIIITDDLNMNALSTITTAAVEAILAGNDLIITTDYEDTFNEIKQAVNENIIEEELINKIAFKNIAWKYYKGLMFENLK